jgi:hypothetical protein
MRESAFFDEEDVDRATPTDDKFVQVPSATSSWDALPNRARSALIQFDMEERDWRRLFPDFDNYLVLTDREIRLALRQDSDEYLVDRVSSAGFWQISLCGSIHHLAARRKLNAQLEMLGES